MANSNNQEFNKNVDRLLKIYKVIELDSLYEIYKKVYSGELDKDEFMSSVFTYAEASEHFNIKTLPEGISYAVQAGQDLDNVLAGMEKYCKDRPYAAYSKDEIAEKSKGEAYGSDWMDEFISTVQYHMDLSDKAADEWLDIVVSHVIEGDTVDHIIDLFREKKIIPDKIEAEVDLWKCIWGLMVELPLPMLKGRTREMYAIEIGAPDKSIDMLSDDMKDFSNTSSTHLYQFPAEIQGAMYSASTYGIDRAFDKLQKYKKENAICSEEYIYLMADSYMKIDEREAGEVLIEELKQGSSRAKKCAEDMERLYDFDEDKLEEEWDALMKAVAERSESSQPFVRKAPKVGRNDPCPCGSGKKYKKCCGR